MTEAGQIKKLQHEVVLHILADDGLWQKIGTALGLTDHDLSRVWDHARAQLRNESGGVA